MAKYDFICKEKIGKLSPVLKDGKWGLVDFSANKEVFPPVLDVMPEIKEEAFFNNILVRRQGLYGVVSLKGLEIIPTIYENITFIPGCLIKVYDQNHQFGLFDAGGKECIPCKYSNLVYITPDIIILKNDSHYGAVTINNKVKIPFEYDYMNIEEISDGNMYITVSKGDKSGLLDRRGKIVIPIEHQTIQLYKDGYVTVINEKGVGITNILNGQEFSYNDKFVVIDYLGQGMFAAVDEDSKVVLMNQNAEVVSEEKYEYISEFSSDGIANAKEGEEEYVIIDKEGKKISHLSLKYYLEGIGKGLLIHHAKIDKEALINVKGEQLTDWYSDISSEYIEKGYLVVTTKDSKVGLVNLKGELVLPTIYLSIRDIDDNGQVTLEYVDHLERLQIGYTWL